MNVISGTKLNADGKYVFSSELPDYLSFVDEDIRAMFEGKGNYFLQDILTAQLIKELRRLNEVRK